MSNPNGLKKSRFSPKALVCVTGQTHDIRVYGLCDGARFSVPLSSFFLKTREESDIIIYAMRPASLPGR